MTSNLLSLLLFAGYQVSVKATLEIRDGDNLWHKLRDDVFSNMSYRRGIIYASKITYVILASIVIQKEQ